MILFKLTLLFLQLTTFSQSSASSLEMVRDFIKDSLYCGNDVTCSDLGAVQLTSKECDCRGGTFMKVGETYECVKDTTSVSSECEFYFKEYENEIPTISVHTSMASEFMEPVVSKTTQCTMMALTSVDYFNVGLQTWIPFTSSSFTVLRSSSGSFSIRWINPFSVDKDLYSGNLIKFNLNCDSLTKQTKSSYCAIGKIVGSRNWTDSTGVCSPSVKPTAFSPPAPTTGTSGDGKSSSKAPLIGAIVASLLILVLIVVVVLFYSKRKCPSCCHKEEKKDQVIMKKHPSLSDIQIKNNSDYAEPGEIQFSPQLESPTNFENKSYLTALRGGNNLLVNNNKTNYVNFPHHANGDLEPDQGPTKPLMTSNNDYEQIYEDPDKQTNNYEPLGDIAERPTYHTLNIPTENEDEFYEDMTKSGTV